MFKIDADEVVTVLGGDRPVVPLNVNRSRNLQGLVYAIPCSAYEWRLLTRMKG